MKTKNEQMLDAYIECAFWSSVHFEDENDSCGTPMDGMELDLAGEAKEAMAKDCDDFLDLLETEGVEWQSILSDEQMGHDFWLTRNGHGAGFWDRGIGELGDTLTKWAKSYGSCDLYVGDDGQAHIS